MDVVFNYVFIYVMGMGVMGAAMGTGIAEFMAALLMLYFLLFRSDMLGLFKEKDNDEKLYKYRPTQETVSKAFRIGAPMALQHVLMGSAQIVSTIIVAPLGTIAIAAHSLAITVESLCYMPGFGIAEAATTLVGQGIGASQWSLTRSFSRMSVSLGIIIMTMMGVLMWVFAPELMTLMTSVDEIIATGATCLRIEAFAEPMFAASIVAYGVFVGAGDTLIPCAMNLGSIWVVRITLAILLSTTMGLQGVWIAMATELCFRGVIFLIRLRGDSWMKKIPLNA
jgi:putative MATE family efflux protein